MLDRSSVVVIDGAIEARFTVALPARGRSIMGEWAATTLTTTLPQLVDSALLFASCDAAHLDAHLRSVEDQKAARDQLAAKGLVAFVADGSVLPRRSGAGRPAAPPSMPSTAPPAAATPRR